jgi:hypothetical protein
LGAPGLYLLQWLVYGNFFFIALALDLGIHASHVFREEIQWRTLSLLQLLPIPLWSWCSSWSPRCSCIR